ncbi:hypothetical protein [Nocardia seriolae]|nr:hypothetical protein [Nocardia seriolae]WKY55449.1 hypothetical protein Q5P07_16355 [Nocardia seriolae]WNJ56079.1 hypothetical protein RMO66_21440 [Nocardia seriolae]
MASAVRSMRDSGRSPSRTSQAAPPASTRISPAPAITSMVRNSRSVA